VLFAIKQPYAWRTDMTETPDTEDFSFTSRDVTGLIRVLSSMAGELTRGQWGLLVSIFATAAGNVEVGEDKTRGKFSGIKIDGGAITDPRNKKIADLRKQLQKAYMPGKPPGAPLNDMITPPKKKPGP
jgi:hypothetical protein